MPSGRKRLVVRHPVVVDVGCNCQKKLPSFFSCSSKPKPTRTPTLLSPSATTSHWETSFTATTTRSTTTATAADSSSPSRYGDCASPPPPLSYTPETPKRANAWSERKLNRKKDKGAGEAATRKGVVERSVAVVKDSSDPYLDFRDSMLQMIVEMEIYSWEGLRDLLHRFLILNADHHHHLILRAFVEIWNSLCSPCSPSLPVPPSSGSAPPRRRR